LKQKGVRFGYGDVENRNDSIFSVERSFLLKKDRKREKALKCHRMRGVVGGFVFPIVVLPPEKPKKPKSA